MQLHNLQGIDMNMCMQRYLQQKLHYHLTMYLKKINQNLQSFHSQIIKQYNVMLKDGWNLK
ncbi:unnamed protein product [Paramecium sonneborni]|uniref:Uncharacterized protein n=1 Tax=Paramecium sonneborni TaxID=65129 RepID=A0A8S1KU24_9CILI|nr:unnamed protein product [Paramecium sonneborni]